MAYYLKRLMDISVAIYRVLIRVLGKMLRPLKFQVLQVLPIQLPIPQSVFVQTVVAMIPIVIELQAILFREKLEPIPSMDKAMILGGFS